MSRDFAKNKKKRNSASRFDKKKNDKSIPAWTWIIAGLLVGVISTVLVLLSLKEPESQPTIVKQKEAPSAKSRYQAVPADEASDEDLDFHNLLENKVVEIPKQNQDKITKKPTNKRYIMQCGSFRKLLSAESLKAKIAMNGFTAKISATDVKNGKRWFRVALGPYESKRLAESERHQLERNNINNCRIW
ncbi:MAG: cell division protein FtsN [Enterobacterales bacterium]|jgi:cell division protein FtsN